MNGCDHSGYNHDVGLMRLRMNLMFLKLGLKRIK